MSKKIVIADKEKIETYLECQVDQNYTIIELLTGLNKKKKVQIENQQNFEKGWRNAKLSALGLIALGIFADIIRPSEDGGQIIDRVIFLIDKLSGV